MFRSVDKLKIRNSVLKSEYIRLILALACFSAAIFSPFIFGRYLFLYEGVNSDTYHSYYSLYQLIVNMFKNRNFSFYSMVSGQGTNVITYQSVIFDPFALPIYITGIVFGNNKLADALVFAHILRIICAGSFCFYFLSSFRFQNAPKYLASVCFAFSGVIIGIGQHYFFATAPIFLVLILAFAERMFTVKKYFFHLTIALALSFIWSVYLSYMIVLALGIYALIRLCQTENSLNVKKLVFLFLPVIISVLFAIILSSVIFIPSVLLLLNSNDRVANEYTSVLGYFRLIDFNLLYGYLLRFFSEQLQGGVDTWQGPGSSFNMAHLYCSILLPIAAFQYVAYLLKKPTNRFKITTVASVTLLTAFIVTYMGGFVFNAFSGYTPRYLFVLQPLFALLIAHMLERVIYRRQYYVLLGYVAVCCFAILVAYGAKWEIKSSKISALCVLTGLACCQTIFHFHTLTSKAKKTKAIMRAEAKKTKTVIQAVAFLLFLTLGVESAVNLLIDRRLFVKDYFSAYDPFIHSSRSLFEAAEYNFIRVERTYLDYSNWPAYNYGGIEYYRGLSFYNSSFNKNILNFNRNIITPTTPDYLAKYYSANDFSVTFDEVIADFFALRYIFSGYKINSPAWEETVLPGGFLYENKSINTAGLLYYDRYTTEFFNTLDSVQKQALLAHAVVLDETVSDEITTDTANIEVEYLYDVILIENIEDNSGKLQAENYENFITFTAKNNIDVSFPLNSPAINKNNSQTFLCFDVVSDSPCALNIYYDIGFGTNNFRFAYNLQIAEQQQYGLRIPRDTQRIRFEAADTAKITLSDLKIGIAKKGGYSNEGVFLQNPQFNGKIFGLVTTLKPGILVVPVPYENGWTVKLDGTQANLMMADFCYLAVEVPSLEHKIEFLYQTPGLKIGTVISLLGVLCFCALIFMLRKPKSRLYSMFYGYQR